MGDFLLMMGGQTDEVTVSGGADTMNILATT